ncbi:MAG: hypothetical protein PHV55_03780 [Candidatus Omnitrophica bacterium]|nr:hypothetical protein [Candidatus Omnitrophota bacterium]
MDRKVALWVIVAVVAVSCAVILISMRRVTEGIQKEEQEILLPSPQKETITMDDDTIDDVVEIKQKEVTEAEEISEPQGEKLTGPLLN